MSIILQNDLGGRQYSDAEQRLIYAISLRLKARDHVVQPNYRDLKPGQRPLTPKHYMQLYAKAACALYETAKALCAIHVHPDMPKRHPGDWLRIIMEKQFEGAVDFQTGVDWGTGPSVSVTLVYNLEGGTCTPAEPASESLKLVAPSSSATDAPLSPVNDAWVEDVIRPPAKEEESEPTPTSSTPSDT